MRAIIPNTFTCITLPRCWIYSTNTHKYDITEDNLSIWMKVLKIRESQAALQPLNQKQKINSWTIFSLVLYTYNWLTHCSSQHRVDQHLQKVWTILTREMEKHKVGRLIVDLLESMRCYISSINYLALHLRSYKCKQSKLSRYGDIFIISDIQQSTGNWMKYFSSIYFLLLHWQLKSVLTTYTVVQSHSCT